MSAKEPPPHDLIFGAKVHDPAFWEAHPLVSEAETQFDGSSGWVGLWLRKKRAEAATPNAVIFTTSQSTRDDPDLQFYGEGECPLYLFEYAPRVKELRVATEGPVDGDERDCWSVSLWLTTSDSSPR